jgi:nickel-type superoxide dismutase maturation protease
MADAGQALLQVEGALASGELNESSWRELLLWLLRFRKRFRVTGTSMAPLLQPGDEVLVDPHAYQPAAPCVGDVVVSRHPYRADVRLVKRITAILEDGRCLLEGDNLSDSTDSRSFGAVAPQQILGRVVSRFPR